MKGKNILRGDFLGDDMTDTELSALESLAKAVTPGQKRDIEAYSAFIAAANPAAILELIAELRQTRAERDWLAHKIAIDGVSCPVEPNVCTGTCEDHIACWLQAAKEAVCQMQNSEKK